MALRGTFQLTDPDNVNMTLTITMTMKEWRHIQTKLNRGMTNSEWVLDASISDMIDQATTKFRFERNESKKD